MLPSDLYPFMEGTVELLDTPVALLACATPCTFDEPDGGQDAADPGKERADRGEIIR